MESSLKYFSPQSSPVPLNSIIHNSKYTESKKIRHLGQILPKEKSYKLLTFAGSKLLRSPHKPQNFTLKKISLVKLIYHLEGNHAHLMGTTKFIIAHTRHNFSQKLRSPQCVVILSTSEVILRGMHKQIISIKKSLSHP